MKRKDKEPAVPAETSRTARQGIISVLEEGTLSSKEISYEVRIPERDVYENLQHIQKTLNKKEHRLIVTPSRCKKCGFTFSKRERLKKPGKCPVCRGESITDPLFSIRKIRGKGSHGSQQID